VILPIDKPRTSYLVYVFISPKYSEKLLSFDFAKWRSILLMWLPRKNLRYLFWTTRPNVYLCVVYRMVQKTWSQYVWNKLVPPGETE